jgi:uncharacterized protein (UPF0335 family)
MQEVVDSQDLINTISKLEKLEEEKRELADVTKDAYNEAKSKGYDVKIIKGFFAGRYGFSRKGSLTLC